MLLTSSCSHQNHTKNPQHLPMRRESTCHLVEHIISSWRKKTNKKTTLSDCWTQCPPITASNVPHSPLPPCHCDATLPSSSVSSHESNILPPFQLLFLISNPTSHHTLFSLLRPPPPLPLVPRTHCELWHSRCFKGLFSALSERLADFYFVSRQQL